jgi:hypothetical protein
MINIEVQIVGNALNSFGFTAFDTVEGLGLNTFGFVWPIAGIWNTCDEPITTVWSDCTTC